MDVQLHAQATYSCWPTSSDSCCCNSSNTSEHAISARNAAPARSTLRTVCGAAVTSASMPTNTHKPSPCACAGSRSGCGRPSRRARFAGPISRGWGSSWTAHLRRHPTARRRRQRSNPQDRSAPPARREWKSFRKASNRPSEIAARMAAIRAWKKAMLCHDNKT